VDGENGGGVVYACAMICVIWWGLYKWVSVGEWELGQVLMGNIDRAGW
jgi:hypothetical protein